jgi:Tfp pilus assembly protein PilF
MIQGDAEGALREYRSAVQADPESGAALVNLALALMRRGDAVEARNILENAVRANPGLLEAHLRLGELLVASGETASAREHLRRASESPDPRIRRAAAEAIAEIQK